MKKLSVIFVLILIVTMVATMTTFAYADSLVTTLSAGNDNIHLLNPVALTYNNNKLYIADNISTTQSAIHVFDISSSQPTLDKTINISGNVKVLQTIEQSVYVLQSKQYLVINDTDYTYQSHQLTTERLDMTIVNGTEYYITQNGQFRHDAGWMIDQGCTRLVTIDNKIYILNNSQYSCYVPGISFEDGNTPVPQGTLGILEVNGTVATFTGTAITLSDGKSYTVTPQDKTIKDIAANGSDLYVLSDNIVTKWTKNAEGYSQQQNFTIGSDTVELTLPDINSITSYTLATAKSYPANIIYKTTGTDTIPNLIDNGQEHTFIILGYDGDEQRNFYYVYVDGKFGWIMKSAITVTQDRTIAITDTTVGTSIVQYKTKFISANAVYVYSLPCDIDSKDNYKKYTHEQTASNRTEVTLLQQFVATDGTKWYYVSYNDDNTTKYGFVLQTDVGQIYSSASSNEVPLDTDTPQLKINARLWDNVGMYLTSSLDEEQKLVDENTQEQIKLRSGTQVNVIERTDTASFVQVVNRDKTYYYGWVSNDRLIPTSAMTTNTLVGLIIMFVAIALTVTTVLIILRRKKIAKKNPVIDLE